MFNSFKFFSVVCLVLLFSLILHAEYTDSTAMRLGGHRMLYLPNKYKADSVRVKVTSRSVYTGYHTYRIGDTIRTTMTEGNRLVALGIASKLDTLNAATTAFVGNFTIGDGGDSITLSSTKVILPPVIMSGKIKTTDTLQARVVLCDSVRIGTLGSFFKAISVLDSANTADSLVITIGNKTWSIGLPNK